jgi:hypothetical protein
MNISIFSISIHFHDLSLWSPLLTLELVEQAVGAPQYAVYLEKAVLHGQM